MKRAPDDVVGIVRVDKPAGPTSHDVVQWARRAFATRAVGHFGTLDPPATGLLVLGLGAATRLGPWMTGLPKTYQARLAVGVSTHTDDAEGRVLETVVCPPGTAEAACAVLPTMVGPIMLPPPVVSAVHIDGERAHARVRRGETVEPEPRPMLVTGIDDVTIARADERVEIDCTLHVGSGTYVRSLARELGRRLGLPAHLVALRRTRVGTLTLEGPLVVRPQPRLRDDGRFRVELPLEEPPALEPIGTGLPLPRLTADTAALERLARGQRAPAPAADLGGETASPVWIEGPGLGIVAVREGAELQPRRVLRWSGGA